MHGPRLSVSPRGTLRRFCLSRRHLHSWDQSSCWPVFSLRYQKVNRERQAQKVERTLGFGMSREPIQMSGFAGWTAKALYHLNRVPVFAGKRVLSSLFEALLAFRKALIPVVWSADAISNCKSWVTTSYKGTYFPTAMISIKQRSQTPECCYRPQLWDSKTFWLCVINRV